MANSVNTMDIEEGEIIISDVSSDESISHQVEPWNRDKINVEYPSFRYRKIPSAAFSSSDIMPDKHSCGKSSYCRQTFSWHNCLAKGSSAHRPRRSAIFSSNTSRTRYQRSRTRQKHNEHVQHSHIHETKKPKKEKRKSKKNKPERTLRQLINHCENRSVLINEMLQQTTTPSTAIVSQENNSLMQKLITSGLAKPPLQPEAPLVVAPGSEPENCVKNEGPMVNIENQEYSDDSEIEVIIPPKKVPPLVTLDSDGEEVEQSVESISNNLSIGTINKTQQSLENNIPLPDQNEIQIHVQENVANLGKNHSVENLSPHKSFTNNSHSPDSPGFEPVLEIHKINHDKQEILENNQIEKSIVPNEIEEDISYASQSIDTENSSLRRELSAFVTYSSESLGFESLPESFEAQPYSPSCPVSVGIESVHGTNNDAQQILEGNKSTESNKVSNSNEADIHANHRNQIEKLSHHKDSSAVSNSSESLGFESLSELCEAQPYSPSSPVSVLCEEPPYTPSSPSTCYSSDVNSTKNVCSPSIGNLTSHNLLSNKLQHKDSVTSTVHLDISTEIWLDLNEQQSSENQERASSSIFSKSNTPDQILNEKFINLEVSKNQKLGGGEDSALSALVEDYNISTTSSREKSICHEENLLSCRKPTSEYETGYTYKKNVNEETSCENIRFVENQQPLTNTKDFQVQSEETVHKTSCIEQYNQGKSGETNITFSIGSHQSPNRKIQCNDQEPHSPSVVYNGKTPALNVYPFTLDLNPNNSNFITNHKPSGNKLEFERADFMELSLPESDHIDLESDVMNIATETDVECESMKDNSVSKHKDHQDKNKDVINLGNNLKDYTIGNITSNFGECDEEENVSQLRMIALQTKGKMSKETRTDKCIENKKSLACNQNSKNVKPRIKSDITIQNTLCNQRGDDDNNDDEEDVLQLRVAALKSAVLKKYGDRKKKGLLIKKGRQATSGLNATFTSLESNFASAQEYSIPLSPAKSSTSHQGEADMELAESDFGEDIIEDNFGNSTRDPDPTNAQCSSASLRPHSMIEPSTVLENSRNPALIITPEVDKGCSGLINQTMFTSILPPPPPPPPPVFSPIPPPPPPVSTTKSFLLPNQSSAFLNDSISRSPVNLDPLYEEVHCKKFPESSSNYESLVNGQSNNRNFSTSLVRANLITVPVVETLPKPLSAKTKLRRKKRKRNKSLKNDIEQESNLLCLTKSPAKSSMKLDGSSVNSVTQLHNQIKSRSGNESSPNISFSNYKVMTPVILCKTDPKSICGNIDNRKKIEETRQNQEFVSFETTPTKSKLSTEISELEDEIDLSEMIVLDEVGMSPEHTSKYEHSSTQEEDDDEDMLRIRALTSLPCKPGVKKTKNLSEVSDGLHYNQPVTHDKSFENSGSAKNDYGLKTKLVSPKVKLITVQNQRRVIGIDTSKYRLTRTTRNEQHRSVVQGKDSLKVVVPTSSPSLVSEPPLPVVKRLIINVNKDSDSEEECEWTRKIRVQDTSATLPPGPVDYELERSIDELLMRARNSVDSSSLPKQSKEGYALKCNQTSKETKGEDDLRDTPIKLLPKETQEEYLRLKAILERKERERRLIKKLQSVQATDKSKPLLHHVLINENNKVNKMGSNYESTLSPTSFKGSNFNENKRKTPDQGSSTITTARLDEMKSRSDSDFSSDDAQGPVKRIRKITHSSNSHGKENVPQMAIYHETQKIEVEPVQENAVSYDKDSESMLVESSNENVKMTDNIGSINCTDSLNNKQNSLDSTDKSCDISEMEKGGSPMSLVICQTNEKISSKVNSLTLVKNSLSDLTDKEEKEKRQGQILSVSSKNEVISKSLELEECMATSDTEFEQNEVKENNQTEIQMEDLCREPEYQGGMQCKTNEVEDSDLDKENGATEGESKVQSSTVSDHSNLVNKELQQNDHTCEVLTTKKSELLDERFGMLDDLSEMAEALDELDGQQGRLEQAAVEISALRRALRTAEDTLRQQVEVARCLERKLYDTHNAVSVRYTNIAQLEETLHSASFEIPSTAQKLMSKKIKQVKDKMDRVKEKRSIVKFLLHKPDTTKEELLEMHNRLHTRREDANPDEEVVNRLWIQDLQTSQLEDFPVRNIWSDCSNKSDTETQTLSSSQLVGCDSVLDLQPQERNNKQTIFKTTNSEMKTLDSVDISMVNSSLKNTNFSSNISVHPSKQIFNPSSEINDCSSNSKNVVSKETREKLKNKSCNSKSSSVSSVSEKNAEKQNISMGGETCNDIVHCIINNRNTLETNKNIPSEISEGKHKSAGLLGLSKQSKLQYKSILQFRDSASRVTRQGIVCPYDLTGKCQDKECKFEHFH